MEDETERDWDRTFYLKNHTGRHGTYRGAGGVSGVKGYGNSFAVGTREAVRVDRMREDEPLK